MSDVSKAILNQTGLIRGRVRLTVISVTRYVRVFIMFPVKYGVYFMMDDHQKPKYKTIYVSPKVT